MLLLCALGLLPKTNIPFFSEPTLFAPDLLINSLPFFWRFLHWVEIGLGFCLIMGIFTRLVALMVLILVFITLGLYGIAMVQYLGFYVGICFFLIINGGGAISVIQSEKKQFYPISLLMMQCLTGINFIYSALSIKWAYPNIDIFMLDKSNAFTFGIPYDHFVLIMLIVEVLFGLILILGRKLRLISLSLFSLFLFLSIDLSENILSHSFIFGILSVFIIIEGYPLTMKQRD